MFVLRCSSAYSNARYLICDFSPSVRPAVDYCVETFVHVIKLFPPPRRHISLYSFPFGIVQHGTESYRRKGIPTARLFTPTTRYNRLQHNFSVYASVAYRLTTEMCLPFGSRSFSRPAFDAGPYLRGLQDHPPPEMFVSKIFNTISANLCRYHVKQKYCIFFSPKAFCVL